MATVGKAIARGAMLALLLAVPARGQMPTPTPIDIDIGNITVNYVYAAQLGFGGYSIGGLDVAVYTLPLAYTFSDLFGPGYDLRIRLPVQYGNYQFQAHPAGAPKITVNANTLAGIPGVELFIPLTRQWRLRPYAEWGLLTAFEPDSLTQLWSVGVRSLYEQPWQDFTFSLGQALLGAGNVDVNGGDAVQYGTLENGIAASHPLGFELDGTKPYGSLFFIWYYFFPDMQFSRAYRGPLLVQNQYEIGTSIGQFIPFTFYGLEKQQVGVSFRFGEFSAVHMNVGFPF